MSPTESKKFARQSAGILLYRFEDAVLKIFLVHPGGPFWKNKDNAAWSIPKGEFTDEENALVAAKREFKEETSHDVPGNDAIALTPVKQNSRKTVYAFAVEGNVDASKITSNTIAIEWPPKSGKMIDVPEVDRAGWFTIEEAKQKIIAGQLPLIDELISKKIKLK